MKSGQNQLLNSLLKEKFLTVDTIKDLNFDEIEDDNNNPLISIDQNVGLPFEDVLKFYPINNRQFPFSFDITVLSDTHILPEYMIADNKAFTIALNSDRKLFEESQSAFLKALSLAEKNQSKAIFITGDLTKDGEYESHQFIAECLQSYKKNNPNVRIYLIPGNHDINNHNAMHYNAGQQGGQVRPATLTTPQLFFDNYRDILDCDTITFYQDSVEFKSYLANVNDTYKRLPDARYYAHGYLSYVDRIDLTSQKGSEGLTVIALDTAQYSVDSTLDKKDGIQDTEGQVSLAQMKWLVRQAKLAHDRNDIIMVLAHHAFIPHFYQQDKILSPYIINNWNVPFVSDDADLNGYTPAEILANLGIQFLFTGHMHAQDIAKFVSSKGNPLYDIETGSTISTPSAIRHLRISNTHSNNNIVYKLSIKSETLGEIKYTDRHKANKVVTDLKEHGAGNLITEELVVGLWNHHLHRVGISKLNYHNILQKTLGITVSMNHLINPMIKMGLKSLFEENKTIELKQDANHIKFSLAENNHLDDVNPMIVLDIRSSIMKLVSIDQRFNIRMASLEFILNHLLNVFEIKVLSNSAILDQLVYRLAEAFFNSDIEIQNQQNVTMREVVNFAYIGHLQGDENQPDWIQKIIEQFKERNYLLKIFIQMCPVITEILWDLFDTLEYPKDMMQVSKDTTRILEFDQRRLWTSSIESKLLSFMGHTVKDTIINLGYSKPIFEQALKNNVRHHSRVTKKISDWSSIVSDIIRGLTNENFEEYIYAYIEDNDTEIENRIKPYEVEGKMKFDNSGMINLKFKGKYDIHGLEYYINNTLRKTLKVKDLNENDEIYIVINIVNEWNQAMCFKSNTLIFIEINGEPKFVDKQTMITFQQKYINHLR